MRPPESFLKKESSDVANQEVLAEWQNFYENDLSGLTVPKRQLGIDRLIVVDQGLVLNKVFQVCEHKFPTRSFWKDLGGSITSIDRTLENGPYAIYVRNRVEADEELKNLSAAELNHKGVQGINLLERLIFEWKYFMETGKHLDLENVTLCSDSRALDDKVPAVRWTPTGLSICWYGPFNAYPYLRAREVVF